MDKELARSFLATFGVVFFAELGDKTQLATMAISGGATGMKARWVIFAAAASALVATSAIGTLVGAGLNKFVSPVTVQRIGGIGFVLAGVWMFLRARP
ncbi:MAG: TMEM165/GDT1 family protein [Polyangiales bacterium]